jgi:hypothetical protein
MAVGTGQPDCNDSIHLAGNGLYTYSTYGFRVGCFPSRDTGMDRTYLSLPLLNNDENIEYHRHWVCSTFPSCLGTASDAEEDACLR